MCALDFQQRSRAEMMAPSAWSTLCEFHQQVQTLKNDKKQEKVKSPSPPSSPPLSCCRSVIFASGLSGQRPIQCHVYANPVFEEYNEVEVKTQMSKRAERQ